MKTCSIPGCGRKHLARSYCNAHWHRLNRYGDPAAGGAMRAKPEDRLSFILEALSSATDACILWPYGKSVGYGTMKVDGKIIGVHHYVCERAHGSRPLELPHAAHSCGVRACVNPRHIRWATQKENAGDRRGHGTGLEGEKHPLAILTADQVRAIRRECETDYQYIVARKYGVSAATVSAVVNRRNWPHID